MYILQETSSQDEYMCGKQKVTSQMVQKASFKIHEDKLVEEKAVVLRDSKIRQLDLPETITKLHRQPLQEITAKHDILEEDSIGGSPMSLDKSGVLSTPVNQRSKSAQELLLDVDEYREEIYLYLHEAEVCKWIRTVCSCCVSIVLCIGKEHSRAMVKQNCKTEAMIFNCFSLLVEV
jgi:hypothetical protein